MQTFLETLIELVSGQNHIAVDSLHSGGMALALGKSCLSCLIPVALVTH